MDGVHSIPTKFIITVLDLTVLINNWFVTQIFWMINMVIDWEEEVIVWCVRACVCADDVTKSGCTSSGLQEVNGWSGKRVSGTVVRKSLQPNLIKAAVRILAWTSLLFLLLFLLLFFHLSPLSYEFVRKCILNISISYYPIKEVNMKHSLSVSWIT